MWTKDPMIDQDRLLATYPDELSKFDYASTREGRKDDQGKNRMDLLPVDALNAIGRVLTYGADKYGARNWEKGMRWGRVYGALLRHLFAWWSGEKLDPETQEPHLAHAACCVLFLLSFELRGKGDDDRP